MSDDDDEVSVSFPNSQRLIKEAFADADPVPLLVNLLKAHETYPVVFELVQTYIEEVEENPSCGHHLASSMSRLATTYDSRDAPSFGTKTLEILIGEELADHHFKPVCGSWVLKGYGPNNTHLLHSLLSGLSLKYGLTVTSDMLAAIDDGLDARPGSDDADILVVGACIQLLLHGSQVVTEKAGSYRKTAQRISSNLESQKAMGTVKDPNAITILELAIQHAKTGLKAENENDDDIWAILFPSWP